MTVEQPLRILICSTPVGPLGSGVGGGVELTLHSLTLGLTELGHHVEVVAPAGSLHVGERLHQIDGNLQQSSQGAGRHAPIDIPTASVLANMWDFVRGHQHRFDVVLNLAYDWLPLYVAPFLRVPVAHLISMGSLTDAMDEAILGVHSIAPESIAVHSRAQADTFDGLADVRVVGSGISLERYDLRRLRRGPLRWDSSAGSRPRRASRTSPRSRPAPGCPFGSGD